MLDAQVEEVLERKKLFTAEAEAFLAKFQDFKEKGEASHDSLHLSLHTCVEAGIQEVTANITGYRASYTNPVAKEFWSQQANSSLFTYISDISVAFELMGKVMDESRIVLEVKCPGLLEEFKEEKIVLLRSQSEVANHRKHTEELIKYSDALRIPGNTKNASNPSLVGDFLVKQYRKVRARSILMVILVLVAFLCLFNKTPIEADFEFPNPVSREIQVRLGPYIGGNSATSLITTGPINLEMGIYKGQWEPEDKGETTQESHISGYGVMAYHNGDIFEGYWRKGRRHGNGRHITAKGNLYIGMWVKGEFRGWGERIYADGMSKGGHWKAGQLQGFGQIIDHNGEYLGMFESGVMEGLGLRYANDTSYSAGFFEGNAVRGPGIEYNDGVIGLRRRKMSDIEEFLTSRIIEHSILSFKDINYTYSAALSDTQVGAIAFFVDKPVYFTAVGLGNDRWRSTVVETLQVYKGKSTSGYLLYTHQTRLVLKPSYTHTIKISMERRIALQPYTDYLLLVKYSSGYVFHGIINPSSEQEGVTFRFAQASISGNYTEDTPLVEFYFVSRK